MPKKISTFLIFLLFCLPSFLLFGQDSKAKVIENWGTQEEGQKLLESIKSKFSNFSNRYPGSKGNVLMSKFLEEEFSRLAGQDNVGTILFRKPIFKPGVYFLEFEDGERVPLYTLAPNLIEVSNFENSEFSGNLIYAGEGYLHEIDGKDLTDSAILMQLNSGDRWQNLVPFGAQAILFLENDEYSSRDTDSKVANAPLTMPRFLLRKEYQQKLKEKMGDDLSQIKPIKIIVEKNNKWENKSDEKNHWAYIKGKNDDRVIILGAHYDTNGFVPDLSVNASDDINLALLLALMEKFSKEQPNISIMFVAFNGFYAGQIGPAEFFWYSSVKKNFIDREKLFYQNKKNLYQSLSDYYGSYSREKLDEMRDATTVINSRNVTWKKSLIDVLREKQNKSSEEIMNLSYLMKKNISDKTVLVSKFDGLKDLTQEEKAQISIIKDGSSAVFEIKDDLQSMQSWFFQKDYQLIKIIEEMQKIEEESIKLTRNFAKEENKDKAEELQKVFSSKLSLLTSELENRVNNFRTLEGIEKTTKKISEIDLLQNELIRLTGSYLGSALRLFTSKINKSESITIQKLFNSSFAEQLFILPKEGEKRVIIGSEYEQKVIKYFEDISAKTLGYSQAAQNELDLIEHNSKIRNYLIKYNAEVETPKSVLFFDFNLTFGNDQLGFLTDLSIGMNGANPISFGRSALGEFKEAGNFIANAVNLSKNVLAINASEGFIKKNCFVNTTTTPRFNQFVLRDCLTATGESKTGGIPALTIVTTEDRSAKNNTTNNGYETIDPNNLINQWEFLLNYVPLLVNESNFIQTSLKPYLESYSSYIFNMVQQDNLAISVPETPVEDVIFVFGGQSTSPISGLGERTYHASGYSDRKILMSNALGTINIRNVRQLGVFGFEAFKFDREFIGINNVMDMRKGAKTFKVDMANKKDEFKDYTVAIFPCEKIDLYGVFDYSKMTRYNSVKILDGIQNSIPDNLSVSGMPIQGGHSWIRVSRVPGGFSVFKKPDTTIKLILENKILINAPDSESKKSAFGVGYNRNNLNRKSIAWESFKDARTINTYRNNVLTSKGVKDSLVAELNVKSDGHYEKAKSFLEKKNYSGFFENLYSGFGMTYAAYPKVLQVMNDMIKAVVFYLGLVIPFSFFMQRLCFPVTRIEKQLFINTLVFIGTFFAFRYVHPAFELTDAPIIVLIAFVQIVLALFVFNVLYNKFDSRIKIIQGRTTSGDSASSNILTQALIIGVNNMRKRKVRTVLTCITIILVTFTMLSFTSISSTVDPTLRRTQVEPPYTGVFYAKNSWSGISPDDFVQAFPQHTSSVRRAWFNRNSALFTIQYPKISNAFNASTILGLEKNEQGFLGNLPISGKFFSSDNANEIILSKSMAEILKIDPDNFEEQEVLLMGEKYRLIGFFDQELIEKFKDVRGTSILPQQATGKAPTAQDKAELDESESDGNNSFTSMNAKMMAILPYKKVLSLGGQCISVSLKYDSTDKAWEDTKHFTTFSKENLYLSTQSNLVIDPEAPGIRPGVFFIGSGFSTSIGGLADLIIPLIISATIIMNTMLGAVYERKKEIEIYTAVGLNPKQIGFFFIAESLVYGIIGSVAGYLIGQGISKVLDKTQLLKVDLNFSSLLVVYVMVFTILIVVVSTIYPAFTAVKSAQPSGNNSKKSSLAIAEDTIEILFPFSFTEAKRIAINSYLRDYILKFADASTGSFMSKPISVSTEEHYDTQTNFTTVVALVQKFDIALTPYDLGVTEIVELVTFYHPKVNAFMMKMVIHRVSGTDSNWVRTNQPFSDEIRKLLLRWRVEPISLQEKCQIEGEKLFVQRNTQAAEVES